MNVDIITPEVERFWSKVAVGAPDDCWLWSASLDTKGYGQFRSRGTMVRAHRWSYVAANGSIDSAVHVLHSCDTPRCVNPAHLFTGTHADNMADMAAKGRASRVARFAGDDHPNSRLTADQVADIRRRYTGKRGQQAAFAREFGVTKSAVHLVVHGRNWA